MYSLKSLPTTKTKLWSNIYMHGDACSSLRNLSRPQHRHVSQCLHKILQSSMPAQTLYSDNGKTFVGASEELKKTVKALDNDRIYKALAVANTTWKFNPPYGPHFCGVWERLIQSAKRTLLRILGSRRLSFDTFLTIMVETESILNSRPMTIVAEQPDNEEPLTPNHFLIQRPFNSLPPGQFGDQQPASLKTWKNTQKLMNHIWRRLVKEYLPTLSRRSKWSNSNDRPLKVDDIVWVLKDQTPRGIWPWEESWRKRQDEMEKHES